MFRSVLIDLVDAAEVDGPNEDHFRLEFNVFYFLVSELNHLIFSLRALMYLKILQDS